MENNITPRSVNRKITALKSFYKFLLSEGIVKVNPVNKIHTLKTEKKLPQFIKEDQMDVLLDSLDFGEEFEGERNKSVIELLYFTGIRLSELINLKIIITDDGILMRR